MTIFESTYQAIVFNNNILVQTWKEDSEKMNSELFKSEMVKLGEAFDSKKPESVLINMLNFTFAVAPGVQDWVNKNVNSKLIEYKTKKLGFIVSSDLFTKISVEQTLEENEGSQLTNKYFENEKDALEWFEYIEESYQELSNLWGAFSLFL